MKRSFLRAVLLLALLALISGVVARPAMAAKVDGADQGGRPIEVAMTGAQEAPGPGDPDGSGTAFFTLNQGQRLICYELVVAEIATPTAAHIHRAPAGSPGPVVVPLNAPASGFSSGCAEVDPGLIKEIRQFPERFYVNVHNAPFPGGAVRGQLGQ